MMTNEEARELISHLRSKLSEKGDIGKIILDEIDEAIREIIYEAIDEQSQDNSQLQLFVEGKGGNYPLSPIDELKVYIDVLHAYLVELPECIEKAFNYMSEKFGCTDIEITMHPDFSKDADNVVSVKKLLNAFRESRSRLKLAFDRLSKEIGGEI